MNTQQASIDDLIVITPSIFGDERGAFFESWNRKSYTEKGIDADFVQDNQSISKKGVLRGLHFQKPPYAQGKLVRVIKGSVLDVAVDIRKGSPTYGKYQSIVLSESNQKQFWIPAGFAHGFISLEDDTIFCYKCTNYYHKDAEASLMWNDPDLNIDWGKIEVLLSEKDALAEAFTTFDSPFEYK